MHMKGEPMAGKENREIKNSVFVDLFYEDESAEANEIALFNAIHDEPLPEGTKIRRFRVDNTIYMNFQNDISFDAGGKVIVFGEHQSTVNENMPLRSLLYIGRAYERLVPPRSRYKKKIVSLPTPEFYTFYNGKEKWEKEKELRLSDAYIVKDGEPSLELKVKVINIRPEEHHEILEKCQVLKEYSQFMEIVQNYQISGEEEPYKKAIKECIEKGILADYLMRKGSEVVNMLLDEYDYETDIEVQREEAREEGRKQGEEEGRKQGTLQKTCALIRKKLEKGKTISEIADDLEDTEENILYLQSKASMLKFMKMNETFTNGDCEYKVTDVIATTYRGYAYELVNDEYTEGMMDYLKKIRNVDDNGYLTDKQYRFIWVKLNIKYNGRSSTKLNMSTSLYVKKNDKLVSYGSYLIESKELWLLPDSEEKVAGRVAVNPGEEMDMWICFKAKYNSGYTYYMTGSFGYNDDPRLYTGNLIELNIEDKE